jgi:hypothetical protein
MGGAVERDGTGSGPAPLLSHDTTAAEAITAATVARIRLTGRRRITCLAAAQLRTHSPVQ